MTKRQKFLIGYLVVLGVFSVLFWLYFQGTVSDPNGWRIGSTLAFASGVYIWMLGGALLCKEWQSTVALGCMTVMPLLVVQYENGVFVGLCVAAGILAWSVRRVHREMSERIRFTPTRSLLVAKQMSVFAFSLAMSFGYFLSIRTLSWDDLTPRFRLGEGTITKLLEWGGYVVPALAPSSMGHSTVDEYLRSLNATTSSSTDSETEQFNQLNEQVGRLREQGINVEFSGDPLSSVKNAAEESTLLSGRKQLGTLVGRPVNGNEQISAVFSEVIQSKLFAMVEGSRIQERIPNQVLPVFITLLFFLTVWPIGLLLFTVWSFMAGLLVNMCRTFHWIEIVEHPIVQEQLVD